MTAPPPDDGTGTLVVRGGTVTTLDDGRVVTGDLVVSGGTIAALGAGVGVPLGAAEVDAAGCSVVPLVVETVASEVPEDERYAAHCLRVGHEATFAVVGRRVTRREVTHALVVRPPDLTALVVRGRVVARTDALLPVAGQGPVDALRDDDERLVVWNDTTGYLQQHLGPDGRYSETRDGRAGAYTGRFWLSGDLVVYLDDTPFWAFGRFAGGELHHAGYVMRR